MTARQFLAPALGRLAHFDCASGASGDMCLGALVDAGLSLDRLRAGLRGLGGLGAARGLLKARAVTRAGLRGTQVEVVLRGRRRVSLSAMIRLVKAGRLPPGVRAQAVQVLARLRKVEALVHLGVRRGAHRHGPVGPETLGDLDTLVDVVGTVLGLHLLGVGPGNITASPLNVGMRLAPASAELLRGFLVYSSEAPYELTTPTGAALISTLARQVGPLPPMRLLAVGSGAGCVDPPQAPNLLRLLLGVPATTLAAPTARLTDRPMDRIVVVETDMDDLNPQVYDYVIGRLFRAGALDVTLTPLIMKKGRPGTRLTVLAPPDRLTALTEIIFEETTTLGLRLHEVERLRLPRAIRTVQTRHGAVRIKIAGPGPGHGPAMNGRPTRFRGQPEYEDCRRIAEATGRPLIAVMQELQLRAVAMPHPHGPAASRRGLGRRVRRG